MKIATKCKQSVCGGWNSHRCYITAVKDGYCGVHPPDAVAKSNAKKEARYKDEADQAKV